MKEQITKNNTSAEYVDIYKNTHRFWTILALVCYFIIVYFIGYLPKYAKLVFGLKFSLCLIFIPTIIIFFVRNFAKLLKFNRYINITFIIFLNLISVLIYLLILCSIV